ncbi:MAG: hypothetical protein ABR497_08970 [Kiritimatiellia bacterium]|nr:hypothetical protein [Lentisphaerota bacterium]
MLNHIKPEDVKGNAKLADQWVLFATLEKDDELIAKKYLQIIPDEITVANKTLKARIVSPTDNQFYFKRHIGIPYDDDYLFKVGYFFIPVFSGTGGLATLGLSGDALIQAWLNGDPLFNGKEISFTYPPRCCDYIFDVNLNQGKNILVIRLAAGRTDSTLAVGGPEELRKPYITSILAEPLMTDSRWTDASLNTNPGGKNAVDIGSRLELFADDYMIDDMQGGVERRLHHPVIQETVFQPDKPWEGPISGYYSLVECDGKIRLYYSGRPYYAKKTYEGKGVNTDYVAEQTTCMIESEDGTHFVRPDIGLIEFDGSTNNNIVYKGTPSHNFTPFLDKNPAAKPEERFKAIAYHEKGAALAAYSSPDGIKWNKMSGEPVITQDNCGNKPGIKVALGLDSQNVAFWDENIGRYVCYYRSNKGGCRRIFRCESDNYLNWDSFGELEYTDDVLYQHYTNGIRPYLRAPHIYIGTPARYVAERKKVPDHEPSSISDVILIASHDGRIFDKWEEGFIRPTTDPKTWTDRNNYPVWGMLQTSPEEISIYWTEHSRYPSNRLVRGTVRTDGFVSVHAPGNKVGEMLTRPFIFEGSKLVVNYSTSAIGSVRFELSDESGKAIDGYALADSEVLYGNEIEHDVLWQGNTNLSALAGKTLRLRVRMQDADFYSFKFSKWLL